MRDQSGVSLNYPKMSARRLRSKCVESEMTPRLKAQRMPVYLQIAGSLLLALVAAGCIYPEARGVVETMPRSTSQGEFLASERIEAATIYADCPGEERRLLAETNDEGQFYQELEEPIESACSIHVEHTNYFAREYSLESVCFHVVRPENPCEFIGLTARLIPRGG